MQGVEEVVIAEAARQTAKDALIEGVGDVAGGAYDLGEAAAIDTAGEALKAKAKSKK